MRFVTFFAIGILAGSMITIQSVFNSVLGKKMGNFGLGLFGLPKIEINLMRLIGLVLLVSGAILLRR